MTSQVHGTACACMMPVFHHLTRRSAIGLGLGGALATVLPANAAGGSYEAMLVNCIDPRFTTSSQAYMASQGMKDKFSHFVIAGGPIGVVAPQFADWQKAFWDNLAITIQLHSIKKVVGLTHRDCGAAAVAYGDAIKTDKALETTKHTEALKAFRAGIVQRQTTLEVFTGIMALDGTVEVIS